MFKLNIILLLNFFKLIYIQTQVTSYYQVTTEQDVAESLIEIQRNQALPLVLLIESTSMDLKTPEFFSTVVTGNGRIINHTQFTTKTASKQFLFCPEDNSAEKCLVYKEFQSSEPLQCSKEATPIVKTDDEIQSCGLDGVGTHYSLIYEICPNQKPYDFTSREIYVYEFCYDKDEKRVLYTNELFSHPNLTNSNVLQWERKIQYNMESMDEFILTNQQAFEAAIAEEEERNVPNVEDQERQKKKQKTGKHTYKAQKLIASDDMAFALWRKPTFQYINIELQHEKLIDLWNKINYYIRIYAEKIFVSEMLRSYVRTGVFDLDSKPRDDDQKSNVWIKLIYFTRPYENQTRHELRQSMMVILMDNFIDTTAHNGVSSDFRETAMDEYCEQDSCTESLKKQFNEVGGRIRCCSVTRKLAELFGEKFSVLSNVARIPGINEIIE